MKNAVDLLQLVAEQDNEENDGQIKIRNGVAKYRIISVKDPEMRHGHKTTSYKTDGYKGHVMTGGKTVDWLSQPQLHRPMLLTNPHWMNSKNKEKKTLAVTRKIYLPILHMAVPIPEKTCRKKELT